MSEEAYAEAIQRVARPPLGDSCESLLLCASDDGSDDDDEPYVSLAEMRARVNKTLVEKGLIPASRG